MTKIFKMQKKVSFLLVILIIVTLLSGFNTYDTDDLYRYQWGLKNRGNFLLDKGILAENHSVMYFNKAVAENVFFESSEYVKFYKNNGYNPLISYAVEHFDVRFEEGYNYFSLIPNKRDVVVAIIDTGIDINHPDLADSIWTNKLEIPNNGVDDDNNGYVDDVHGYNFYDNSPIVYKDSIIDIHGTHAAGTIVGKHGNGGIKGIAYDEHIKIMPLKVLGNNGQGLMSSVVEAIYYAKRNGAKICNISLGAYSYEENLDNAIKDCKDMLFIVAAGNGANYVGYSLDERNVYPAKLNYDNVITVSNVGFDSSRYVSANYGSYVDVFAPGTFILSTIPNNNYGYFTGTSMATPYVSALAAMIYSSFPNVPIDKYKMVIIGGATPITNLIGLCKSAGIINVYNTLLLASMY